MSKLKQIAVGLVSTAVLSVCANAHAATQSIYTQNFEGFPLGGGVSLCAATSGLCYVNRSALPADNWGGGNSNLFAAQSGTAGSYLADSYLASGGSGIVSDWLLTPVLALGNGYTFTFFAKGDVDTATFPDSLEVRLSTSGTSVNVGTTPTGVGVFTSLLLSINPALTRGGFPTDWTAFTATVSGLDAQTTGRFAVRYLLNNVVTQGSYIGIDSINVSAVPEPASMAMLALGLTALGVSRRRKASK